MAEAISGITAELYHAIVAVVDERVREIRVTREDFHALKEVVQQLAEAQQELAQAQVRTEQRLDRLEASVEKLAQAQVRTEQRLDRLEASVEKLAQAQVRTEQQVSKLAQAQIDFARTFDSKLGAIGARWGRDTEASFREGMRAILEEVGFKVERYEVYDEEGTVFDQPAPVELDVIVRDGRLMLIEIKSSTGRADVAVFHRKVGFYERREGRKADRRIIVSPFVEEGARDLALALGTEIYTRAEDLARSGEES